MYRIVQKNIKTGEEYRIGNFYSQTCAEETAQRADMVHRDCVHWVEKYDDPEKELTHSHAFSLPANWDEEKKCYVPGLKDMGDMFNGT